MKKSVIITAIFMAFAMTEITAQDNGSQTEMRTLTGGGNAVGGYGAVTTGYSVIAGRDAFEFGFRGMWVVNHTVALGIGSTGFANEPVYNTLTGRDNLLAGAYGGFIIEPVVAPMMPVHVAFPILIGGGGMSVVEPDWDSFDNIPPMEYYLILEPGAEIEMNVARFFRLGVGASYRLPFDFGTTGGGIEGADPSDIRGFSYHLTLKFGKF